MDQWQWDYLKVPKMKAEFIEVFEYTKCELCGNEWEPDNAEVGFIDSTMIYELANGARYCSEQCGEKDRMMDNEMMNRQHEQWRAGKEGVDYRLSGRPLGKSEERAANKLRGH